MGKEKIVGRQLQFVTEQKLGIRGMANIVSVKNRDSVIEAYFRIDENNDTIYDVMFLIVKNDEQIDKKYGAKKFWDTLVIDGCVYHIFTFGWHPGVLW